jgi:hypothetical protein
MPSWGAIIESFFDLIGTKSGRAVILLVANEGEP